MNKRGVLFLLTFIVSQWVWAQKAIEPEMIFVDGGTFTMGNPNGDMDEKPPHKVTLNDFYISKFEITVAQYKMFCEDTGKEFPAAPSNVPDPRTGEDWYYEHDNVEKWVWKDDLPIVNVSWNDAMEYCKWLSEYSGRKYRLPTEAEWEFAARGGNKSKNYIYSGSNNPFDVAWFDESTSESGLRKVGTLKPNELGIYDMSGNASEWCYDFYDMKYYGKSAPKNPKGPTEGQFRVIRGGSWYFVSDMAEITTRDGPKPSTSNWYYGFRVVIAD